VTFEVQMKTLVSLRLPSSGRFRSEQMRQSER
jgi:hypothetical protein